MAARDGRQLTWYPWPVDSMALLERQWDAAVALWPTSRRSGGSRHRAAGLRAPSAPSRLQRPDVQAAARCGRTDHRGEPRSLAPLLAGMDPLAVVRALGPAVYHVHLKDTQVVADRVALAGVLDQRPFDEPSQRAWVFRTTARSMTSTGGRRSSSRCATSATTTCCRSRTRTRVCRPGVGRAGGPLHGADPRRRLTVAHPCRASSARQDLAVLRRKLAVASTTGRHHRPCGRRSGSRGSCSAGGRRSRARAATLDRRAGRGGSCPSRTGRSRGSGGSADR